MNRTSAMQAATLSALLLAPLALGQGQDPADGAGATLATTEETLQARLEASIAELNRVREQLAAEKVPLAQRLAELQGELSGVRAEYQTTTRTLDSRSLDLSNLGTELKSRNDERTYLSNLLTQYLEGFETGLHIAELARYEAPVEEAKLAPENSNLSELEVYRAQASILSVSLDRLEAALGGELFEGTAIDETGLQQPGRFALVGPAALFLSSGGSIGTAEQRLGSLEPAQIGFALPEDQEAARGLLQNGTGAFPLDPTLGDAHKLAATQETFLEHVQKGGAVMYPIGGMAALALLVALYKYLTMAFIRRPSGKRVTALLAAVGQGNREEAESAVRKIGGPTGRMLAVGVEHMDEPRELVEEAMYESVLTTRLKLQGMLPFIAICAASAPLLGLLGTVTGIINTFKLITVFGSGDVKSLSGGISEALITTKFGLIVAIPSLLLHAFLSRKAKGVTDQMEKSAVSFTNQLARTQATASASAPSGEGSGTSGGGAAEPSEDQVRKVLAELLGEDSAATPAS